MKEMFALLPGALTLDHYNCRKYCAGIILIGVFSMTQNMLMHSFARGVGLSRVIFKNLLNCLDTCGFC
jgi:hypothetical protein